MNLVYPTEGVGRSVNAHNSNSIVVADWLELGLLAFDDDGEGISVPECVDLFIEGQIYASQEFCTEFFQTVLGELRTRGLTADSEYPIEIGISNSPLVATAGWRDRAALTFCLVLSVAPYYSGYSEWVSGNYVEQGELFERVAASALAKNFPGWEVRRTGWNGGSGSGLASLVEFVAEATNEDVIAEASAFVGPAEKDLGVDVATVRRFHDRRAALPAIFTQCASGRNWPDKILTPDTSRWKQLLTLTHSPLKSLALPFRLTENEYQQRRSQSKGLLIDRMRLLPAGDETWLDDETRDDLIHWIEPRLAWLREHYESSD